MDDSDREIENFSCIFGVVGDWKDILPPYTHIHEGVCEYVFVVAKCDLHLHRGSISLLR